MGSRKPRLRIKRFNAPGFEFLPIRSHPRISERLSIFIDCFKYYVDNLLIMKSEEFIKACEDGKTLVWGQQGLRVIRKSEKKFSFIDLSSGFAMTFDSMEICGTGNVFMMIGETPVGIIPTGNWDPLFKKEGKE